MYISTGEPRRKKYALRGCCLAEDLEISPDRRLMLFAFDDFSDLSSLNFTRLPMLGLIDRVFSRGLRIA